MESARRKFINGESWTLLTRSEEDEWPWKGKAMESIVSSCSASVFSASEDVPSTKTNMDK